MGKHDKLTQFETAREKLIGLSLESTRKSYYPQLQSQMAELKKAEERYRVLFENANDAIFIAQDDKIKFPNPKTLEILGLDARQLSQRFFSEFIHPDDRDMVLDIYRRKQDGETDLPTTYTFRVINNSGQRRIVQINAVVIIWENRPATLCFIRDISEQKKLEASLRQSQKLEAVGTLAGGIAHDFNNILMGIQGRVSMMLADMEVSHPHFEHIKGIEQYVASAKDLTAQLLGFAKGGKYQITPTDMNLLLEKSSEMFRRTHKEIRITRILEENLWPVEVDRGQMNQVMLNLFVNAWQAMPRGGNLHIQSANVVINQGDIISNDLAPGKYITIRVTDTGVGMERAVMARIFDPFFTTKAMGRGTGLGLASAYGIIKNHKGEIQVSSEVGQGTTFTLFLPASDKQVKADTVSVSETVQGHGNILLVDDEEMVLDVGRQMLEKLGYTAHVADSGRAALEILRQNQGAIDLVILDMIMPDTSGSETFDGLRAIDSNINVLLSSGYSIDGQAVQILERGCDGFIQKPFSLSELSQKIQEIIAKKPE